MTRSRAAVGLCEQQALSVPKSLAVAFTIPRAVPDRRSHASRQALVRPGEQRGRWWLAASLVLAAVFAGRAYWGEASLPAAPQPRQAAAQGDAPASQPIETIRVGQRVVASMAGRSNAEAAADTQVDPSVWRLLRLRAEDRWADGTLDVVRIETLQGPEWIAAHRATVGATVPLPLDLQEMGLPGSLRAVVTANEPCPPVASGPGRVVLTTVNHLNANVLELTLVDGRGRQERLRPTGSHKFFSEDRQEFVAAEELRQREHVRGVGGRLTLLRAERATGVHRVYNMTVEGEHVYRVSLMGALVHNNCPPVPGSGGGSGAFTPKVTPKGLARVEQHLAQFGDDPANQAMIARLRAGETTAQDINFYMHELKESALMARGMEARAAHLETLKWQDILYKPGYESRLYHPNVIRQLPEHFNPAAWPQ
ncbi:MAG: Hint domain-containing protein [Thermoguttaceae bacterium]